MPFKVVRNDLVNMQVDAIVNTANPHPVIGSGTDSTVYEAAGAARLLNARKKIGNIHPGEAYATPAFKLQSRIIIHTVGPIWHGGEEGEEETLKNCYRNSLLLAKRKRCASIAFPLISAGNNGFPKELALQIVISEVNDFLMANDMMVYLVVYGKEESKLSENLFDQVEKYIDDSYVNERAFKTRPVLFEGAAGNACARTSLDLSADLTCEEPCVSDKSAEIEADMMPFKAETPKSFQASRAEAPRSFEAPKAAAPRAVESVRETASPKARRSLKSLLDREPETFQQMLLRLIKERNLTNAQAYTKANQDKKLFSKIKNNKNYQPSKKTVMAFALALKLSIDETKDLLASAGFAFAPASNFDTVIRYCIENGKYNIFEVECLLFDYGLDSLCSY